MDWYKIKRTWRQVWYFIWEDDSWASWFVNVILAFLLIKFIVYPGLGLVLSTSHPIVAVVSTSMEHDGSFDDWWNSRAMCGDKDCTQAEYYQALGISKEQFMDFRFRNGFNKGDLMLLYGAKPEKVKLGNIIVFRADRPDPIIHRVVFSKTEEGKTVFSTKGDHNADSFYFESYIPQDTYIGEAVVRVPFLGYIKIWFVKLMQLIGLM